MEKRKFIIDYVEDVDSSLLVEMLGVYRDSLARLEECDENQPGVSNVRASVASIQRELRRRGAAPRGEA